MAAGQDPKGVEITGISQVVTNLSHFNASIVKEIVDGCTAVQQNVVNMARGFAPEVTGNLKRNTLPGPIIVEDDNVTAYVLGNAPYAEYVEFGTSRQRAQPHLGPALLQNIRVFEKAMAAAGKRARAQ